MRMFAFIMFLNLLSGVSILSNAQQIDVQGHRGARGLAPENTIPAFIRALDLGVTTLELDVVVTGDSMVVVSHEPYISSSICKDSAGNKISKSAEKNLNIYKMSYEEVKSYDCGSLTNLQFPDQEKIIIAKPLLKDVIKAVEKHVKGKTQYEVDYNIEIKSTRSGDDKYHPAPEEFSRLVYEAIDEYLPWNRVIIQSFDFRILKYWHKNYPEVRLSVLIDTPGTVSSKIGQLGFEPAIYSPEKRLLNKQKVNYLHNLGIKVIPWTINDPNQMKKFVEMGVDGIITDYPDRAADLGLTLNLNN